MLVTKGSTNVSGVVRIVDSTDGTPETGVVWNTAGIDMWYRREGAVSTDITEATLAALTTAHTDGGFLHINDGWYRLDVPDAAFASGVNGVQIGGTVTGMVVHAPYVQLTDIDLFDAVRGGMTALPNAAADAAGGLPISDAGGLDLDGRLDAAVTSRLAPTVAGRTLDITATGAAGIDWGNLENPTTAVDLSGTDIQLCDTVTTNTDMRGTDNAALASVVGALADAAAAGDPTTADTLMQYVKQLVNVLVGTTGVPIFPAEAAPANNVSLAEVISAIHADVTGLNGAAMRGTDSAALASVCTEARLAELDAANMPAVLDSRMAEASINTTAGAVDNVTTVATTTTNTDMRGTDSAALASVCTEARLAELDAANLPASVDNLNLGIIYGTAQTGTLSTTQCTTDLTGYADDELVGRAIIFTGGTADGQASDLTGSAAAGGLLTFTAITTAPANGDTFKIV